MRRPTDNIDSYDLWLRAHSLIGGHGSAEVFEALALLNGAVILDPRFAMAASSAAWCHSFILVCGWSDDPEAHRREGLELAHHALRLSNDDPDVLTATAMALCQLEQGLNASVGMTLAHRSQGGDKVKNVLIADPVDDLLAPARADDKPDAARGLQML